jgi:hypothetical protein
MFAAGAHGFYDTGELIRKHRPDVLLIESFLEDRDDPLDQRSGDGIPAHSYSDCVTPI